MAEQGQDAGPVWVFDPDRLRIVWANAAAVAFWGETTLLELIERSFAPESALAQALREAQRVLSDGVEDALDRRLMVRVDDAPRQALCRLRPIRLPDGRLGLETRILADAPPIDAGPRRATLLDELSLAAALFDADGAYLAGNAAAAEAFGFARGRARPVADGADGRDDAAQFQDASVASSGARLSDFIALGVDPAPMRAAIASCLSEGADSRSAMLATRYGPRRHRVEMRRVVDPDTGRIAVAASFRDIDDVETARRAGAVPAPAPWWMSWDALPSGVALLSRDGRLLQANAAARALLGAPVGVSPPFDAVGENDARDQEAWSVLANAGVEGAEAALYGAAAEGDGPWVRAVARAEADEATGPRLVALFDQRPERRVIMRLLSEERLRGPALDALGVAVARVDHDGRVSAAGESLAGLLEVSDLNGRPLGDWLDPDGAAQLQAALAEPGDAPIAFDARVRLTGAPLRASVQPASDGGLVALRRARAGDEVAAVRRASRPEPRPEVLADLLNVGHEIRTQLTTVMGFAELLNRVPAIENAPVLAEYVAGILSSAEVIRDTLAAVEDPERPMLDGDGGRAVVNWVDLSRLMSDLARALGARLEGPPAPWQALIAADALRAALRRLILAARAADPRGEAGQVVLRSAPTAEGALRIEVLIETDLGLAAPEISAETLASIQGGPFDGGLGAAGEIGPVVVFDRRRLRRP